MIAFVRIAVLVTVLATISEADAQSFPTDASWTVVEQQSAPLGDSATDGNGGGREIVGDATNPALYLASDAAYFYVRMRLDTDPTQNGSLRQFGWALLVDTDGDLGDYEYMIMLDGIAEEIVLAANTVKSNLGDPSDPADVDLYSAPIVMGTNVIVGAADFPSPPSAFNADADYFLDFALPWSALTAASLTSTQPVHFLAGTSNNGRSITVELAGTSTSPGAGTLMLGSSDHYPLGLVAPVVPDGAVLVDAGVGEDAALPDAAPDAETDGASNGFTVRGGGCSTTGTGGLGTLVLVLGALLGGLRRRRAFVASLVFAAPAAARAQVSTEFQLERFRLSTDRGGLFDVEWADVLAPRAWSLGLSLGWADDELVVEDDNGNRTGALVDHRLGGDLVGAFAITSWLQVGLDLPLIVNQNSDEPMQVSVGSIDSFALGDLRVAPKLGLLRQSRHGISLAIIPGFSVPTATTTDFAGESGMTFAPELVVSRRFGAVRVGGNLGLRIRDDQMLADLDVDNEAFLRVGAGYRIDKLELGVTTSVATATNNLFDRTNQRHWELLGGAQYDVRDSVVAFGAFGLGLEQGFGTPDWRALLGVRYHIDPAPPARPPIAIPDDRVVVTPPPAANDTDGDTLLDDEDACPAEAEDRDQFEDADGCIDPDNDRDGVVDAADRCPLEPGVASAAGCAESDRDGDTVIDRQDNCPDEAGEPKHAGCKTPQQVALTSGKLEILDLVYFQTSKAVILPKSYGLLDNVAAVLSAHTEITKLRVEGHTDDRGADQANLDLSRRRAEAVVAYLVNKGIAKERLEAEGLGETRPIAPNDSNDNRARNRRVEFVIITR